jgi:hypothetical protein
MNAPQPGPNDNEWLRADQPGPPLRALLRQRRGLLLGVVILALALAVMVVAQRPATPSATAAPGASPSPSGIPFFGLFPVFAYDADHQQVVLLNFHAQTWLWSNHQWVQAHPAVAPPKRTGAAVAWDPGMHAVLLFGGEASGNGGLLHDTWAWNGSSWRDIGTARLAPPPSLMSTMTYDGSLHEMVLVESDIHFGAPIQLWTWDGLAWRQHSVAGGPTSPVAAIGFDPRTRTMVAIAGDCSGFECRSQTWSWDGAAWRQLKPAHEPDFAFYSMSLVPDPISGRLLLVTVSSNALGPAPTQTWAWDGRDWAGLQLLGHPGAEVKIVAANSDNRAPAVFAFEDLSRDFNTVRINAWEWTGNVWRTISP